MDKGYIKLNRGLKTLELLKNNKAFLLLTHIALRAKRTSEFNIYGLIVGEALLGDYKNYGMSRQEYRTALHNLKKWDFITTRTTNRGTIARIIDNSIYDINEETQQPARQPTANQQATTKQPSTNHQTTTNKNDKNEKNDNKRAIDRKKRGNSYGKRKVSRDFTGNSEIGETIKV